ncbi:MAG: BON domain-containing protein [Aridibacter famidurans]|nr:BON domain-containing protein [Aridibacter famidurans]
MKRRTIMAAVLLLALVGVSANSANAQAVTDEQKVEQSRMERKIRSKILSLPYYGVFDAIGYELNGSTVTLKGYVTRPFTKDNAADEVMEVDGVTNVVNDIEVLPPSPSDDRIRVRIYRNIANHGNMYRYLLGANPSIRIVVNRGRVILEGIVTYEGDKTLAYAAASEVFGVLGVTNNIKLERREGEEVS